jgi:hypothetical protein
MLNLETNGGRLGEGTLCLAAATNISKSIAENASYKIQDKKPHLVFLRRDSDCE